MIFRLGRVIGAKGPGLFFIIPIVDRMVKVSLRTVTMDIPPQDVITRDNVSVKVNAVVHFRVMDPVRAVVEVGDGRRVGRLAAPCDMRAERDSRHRDLAVGALFQKAVRLIDIFVDDEAGAAGEVDEEQHMAGRQRGDEGLLGIDRGGFGPGRGDDVRARARRHDMAAVERPFVRAAVLALGEALGAVALTGCASSAQEAPPAAASTSASGAPSPQDAVSGAPMQ